MNRGFSGDDAATLSATCVLAHFGVLLDPVYTFNNQLVRFGVNVNDFALNTTIFT